MFGWTETGPPVRPSWLSVTGEPRIGERQSDPGYSGVVALLGPEYRLVVTLRGERYALQRLVNTPDGPFWVPMPGRPAVTVSKLLERHGHEVPGLGEVLASLPPDPAAAAPETVARQGAVDALFELRRMSSGTYCRVLRVETQLRLLVDPSGFFYVLQWRPRVAYDTDDDTRWQDLRRGRCLQSLGDFLRRCAGDPDDVSNNRARVAERVAELVAGFPDFACDGSWPSVPNPYELAL